MISPEFRAGPVFLVPVWKAIWMLQTIRIQIWLFLLQTLDTFVLRVADKKNDAFFSLHDLMTYLLTHVVGECRHVCYFFRNAFFLNQSSRNIVFRQILDVICLRITRSVMISGIYCWGEQHCRRRAPGNTWGTVFFNRFVASMFDFYVPRVLCFIAGWPCRRWCPELRHGIELLALVVLFLEKHQTSLA